MRLTQYITEKRKNHIISCDIQPMYEKYIHFDLYKYVDFLNSNGNILFLYNGTNTVGVDSKNNLIDFLIENGLEERKIKDIKFLDKGYGFFRDWMDDGLSERDIIKAIRYMFSKKEYDSREIDPEEWEKIIPHIWDYASKDNMIYIPPDIRIDKLKKWSGSFLVGGGTNECLKEIMILMNAFNIRYKIVKEFTY